jgi:ABC-2 type transport system ATP-binding protein
MGSAPAASVRSQTVIHVRELTKRFPSAQQWSYVFRRPAQSRWTTALDNISLDVRYGEIFGLLGANGAGKTTLIKILSTLLLPTGGRAEITGYDVVKSPMEVRRAVGFCLDTERSFYNRLTGIENLLFFAALNNLLGRNAFIHVKKVLEIVELGEAAERPFRTYSRGMQQKLGLARALLTDPVLLLLDEPTKSLDPAAALEFWRFARGILVNEMKKTIFIVTHNLHEARYRCDRVAFMHQGHVTAMGGWEDIESQIRTHGFQDKAGADV